MWEEWIVGRMCAEAVDGAVGGDGASSGRGGGVWEGGFSEVLVCYYSWLV